MNKYLLTRLLLPLCTLLILSSCGGGTGGGTAEFKTVRLSATTASDRLEPDVITGNTCTDPVTPGTIQTESVNVVIASTTYPNFTGTASQVAINSYTIHYKPANPISPTLPDQHGTTIGSLVPPGGTLSLPVAIASRTLKLYLVDNAGLEPCSITMYDYYVTITFDALELNTGETHPVYATMVVEFADSI